MEENKLIGKIGVDENDSASVKEPIFVSLSKFKNFKYIDIRKYYSENGEWKPTKKGVTMNIEQADALFDIIKSNRDDIEKWFK